MFKQIRQYATINSKININFQKIHPSLKFKTPHLNTLSQNLINPDFSNLNLSKINYSSTFLLKEDLQFQNLKTNPIKSFLFLRKSTVTSFFITNMIDIPISLKKSNSLYVKTFEIQNLKLLNFLMRDGNRGLVLKTLTSTLGNFSNKWKNFLKPSETFTNWIDLFYTLNSLTFSSKIHQNSIFLKNLTNTLGGGLVEKKEYFYSDKPFFQETVGKELKKFYPLFNFHIQKIDKAKKKNSRGKIDKLKLIWKYVPPYKRYYQALKWLLKDLKFQKLNKFSDRLLAVFETFYLTPNLSFLWKLKNFIHFFVFKNFKKTLLRTLRSTS